MFRRKARTKDYPAYRREQAIIENEIQTVNTLRRQVGGSMLCAVLHRLPDDIIVNCHFQEQIHNDYHRVTVAWCKSNLPVYLQNRMVTLVQLDRLYDGSKDNLRPIAILELPDPRRW